MFYVPPKLQHKVNLSPAWGSGINGGISQLGTVKGNKLCSGIPNTEKIHQYSICQDFKRFPPIPAMSTMSTHTGTVCSTSEKDTLKAENSSQLRLVSSNDEQQSLVVKDLTAPNFGNDYSNYFVYQKVLPQRWVRNVRNPLEGYPKLEQLHTLKKVHYAQHAPPAIGLRCPESRIPAAVEQLHGIGAHFDVVVVNGCMDHFSVERLKSLRIDLITPRPSLLFLWVSSSNIAEGRQLMDSWGFRRGEDITYMVDSLDSLHAPRPNPWTARSTLFVPTTWHCLMGLKGTLRRSNDTDLINCNIDTDVIIEKPGQRSGIVPEQFYTLIENFTNMERKLHIVPFNTPERLPVRPRQGWVMLAPDSFSVGEFKPEMYTHRRVIPVNKEIDILRPQTPPNQR